MKFILSILLLVICNIGYSQETNKDLIIKAEKELKIAAENEDYEKAASLKKEIEIRTQIEEAAEKGDYETAARLKKELAGEVPEKEDVSVHTEQQSPSNYEYTKIRPPSEGKALVEIIRVTHYDRGVKFPIFVDWELISYTDGVSHVRLELTPGKHIICSPAEKNHYADIDVEAGQTYFIYHDYKPGMWKPDCNMTPVTEYETDRISRGVSVINKYLPKVISPEEKQEILDLLETKKGKKRADWKKAKLDYEQGTNDVKEFIKVVKKDEFIPAKYL